MRKYVEVKKLLQEKIRCDYPEGAKIPSTLALQRALGVSPGTIDRAIRDLVEDGTLQRFTGRGTFVARPDSPTASGEIGLLWPAAPQWFPPEYEPTSSLIRGLPYTAAVLQGVEEEAERHGKRIQSTTIYKWDTLPFLDGKQPEVAGVIIVCCPSHDIPAAYARRGLPVVLVEPLVRAPRVPFVCNDNYAAGYAATWHLLESGHRRILHISLDLGMAMIATDERASGYRSALREFGGVDYCRVFHLSQMHGSPGQIEGLNDVPPTAPAARFGLNRINELLKTIQEDEVSACCCFDDSLASWLLQVCHSHGVLVPERLSVVGINNTGLAAHLWPPLTTIHLPLRQLGQTACRMLLDQTQSMSAMESEAASTGEGRCLAGRLVIRESVRRRVAAPEMTFAADRELTPTISAGHAAVKARELSMGVA